MKTIIGDQTWASLTRDDFDGHTEFHRLTSEQRLEWLAHAVRFRWDVHGLYNPKDSEPPQGTRRIVAQMVKRSSSAERSFDRKFWKQAGHEKRFEASWEMVNEVSAIRGSADVGERGLQRSVQSVQRRKR